MIPSIPYPGGKGRWSEEIAKFVPPGRVYCEPFAGRLNIFLAVANLNPFLFTKWHLNDILRYPFYKAIMEDGHIFRTPSNLRMSYYYHMKKDRFSNRARLLEPIVSRDGGGYGTGGPAGAHHANLLKYQNSIRAASIIMSHTKPKLTALDWKRIGLERLSKEDFVAVDPPYYGADVRSYSSKGFDYNTLVHTLERARFKWILMEYEQPFYNKAFGQPFYRRSSGYGSARRPGSKIECMWKNF